MDEIEVTLYLRKDWAEALRKFTEQFPQPHATGEQDDKRNHLLCGMKELADAIDEEFAGPCLDDESGPVPGPERKDDLSGYVQ